MLKFVTLNTLITDLLLIIRGSKISQSEPISRRQIEAWVHQYRAVLLKRDLDKNKFPNPDYIQTIQALELEEVDETDGTTLLSDFKTFKSMLALPNVLDLNFKPGFMYIGTVNGRELMFVPESRARLQQYKTYTANDPIVYLKGGHMYVVNNETMRYITVSGVFEIPPEVSHMVNPNETIEDVTLNSAYPIPIDVIPTLKGMILKNELGIEYKAPSDTKNDSESKMTPNVING